MDEYDGVVLFRMRGEGLGILTAKRKGNAICFDCDANPSYAFPQLAKEYPGIHFELAIDELENGILNATIYQDGHIEASMYNYSWRLNQLLGDANIIGVPEDIYNRLFALLDYLTENDDNESNIAA